MKSLSATYATNYQAMYSGLFMSMVALSRADDLLCSIKGGITHDHAVGLINDQPHMLKENNNPSYLLYIHAKTFSSNIFQKNSAIKRLSAFFRQTASFLCLLPDGSLTPDTTDFIATFEEILARTSVLVQVSTGGVSNMTIQERCHPLDYWHGTHHPHTQCTYVFSGRFSYSVENEAVVLEPGDSIVVPSDLPHGTVCLEKGVLLDIFTPMRRDFL